VGFPAVIGTPLTHATIAWGAIRIIPCFIYGCAIYLVWRTSALRTRNQAMKGAFFSGAVVTLAALAGGPDLLIVAAFGPMILSFANLSNTQTYSNVGNIFVYLGEASYSIYMLSLPWQLLFVHTVTMGGAQDKSHLSVYVWIVMTITVIPLALLSYNIAERPARALMRRWGRPLQSGESSVAQRSR
jgi:peptidoglycan/LPS O-acetylase OafA/YrhL